LLIWSAKHYSITGMLIVSLSATLTIDLAFFTYRLWKLGYLQNKLIRDIGSKWLIIIPGSLILCWASGMVADRLLQPAMYLQKVIVAGGMFTSTFIIMLFVVDSYIREMVKQLSRKLIIAPYYKIVGAFSAAD